MPGLFGNSMPAQSNALGGGALEQSIKGLKPDQVQSLVRALNARGAVASMSGGIGEDPLRKRRQSFFDEVAGPQQSIGLGVDE
jgi:hypothetical protein